MEEQAKKGEPLTTHYELAQSIYAKAKVNVHEDDKVCLWLGANVMLEYPRAEAIELLAQQQADAKTALATVIDDMGFLRDQITTTEVNMARVFNWDVSRAPSPRPTNHPPSWGARTEPTPTADFGRSRTDAIRKMGRLSTLTEGMPVP